MLMKIFVNYLAIMSLSCIVVMPVYNEAACIENVIKQWHDQLSHVFGSQFLLCAVNDGSTDTSANILANMQQSCPHLHIIHQPNQGHGKAILTGYRFACSQDCEYIFQVDSDNQLSADDFIKLWERRHESRFIAGFRAERHDALHRVVLSSITTGVLMVLFGVSVRDSNVPFRLMERHFLTDLLSHVPAHVFAPNIFLSLLAAKHGEDLLHIPVKHQARQSGQGSIMKWKLLRCALRCMLELFTFRLAWRQR